MLVFKELATGKWLSMYDRLVQVKDLAFKLTDSQYDGMTFIQQSQVIDFFSMMAQRVPCNTVKGRKLKSRYEDRVQRYRRLRK